MRSQQPPGRSNLDASLGLDVHALTHAPRQLKTDHP